MPSNMHKMRKVRSSCTCTKYHSIIRAFALHLYIFNDSVDIEGPDAQADLALRNLYIPKDTFLLGDAHLFMHCSSTGDKKSLHINIHINIIRISPQEHTLC